MKLKSDRKNYVIMALCAILLVMSIGYAAFSSLLTINGTASLSDSFCVGFDNTKTNTYTPTAGITNGTLPTGTMSYSGTACSTNYQPNSSLTATFKQPGDKIEYTLTIANKSTFTVAIESILVENQNVTSNTTITKGNIKYMVEMPLSTTLASNAETTMKVTAMFQNDTAVTGQYSGESQTLNVKINAEQGDSGFTPIRPVNGTVYSYNTTAVTIGTSTVNDLASTKTSQPYYTSIQEIRTSEAFFNKYTVVDDIITEGYACQTFISTAFEPVCLKMSTDGSEYGYDAGGNHTGNAAILKGLSSNSSFKSTSGTWGSCNFSTTKVYCFSLSNSMFVEAYPNGRVHAYNGNSGHGCSSATNGEMICN